MNEILTVATEAARQAGAYQREQFTTDSEYDYKAPGDPVSEIDYRSEEIIMNRLSSAFPDDQIISEESGTIGEGANRWIIDPLDGTSNYVRGIPDFTVSIALERDDQVDAGVIYRPMSDDLFVAARGTDTADMGAPIGVSETNSLTGALVAVPYSSSHKSRTGVWDVHRSLGSTVEGIRSTGSGALDLAHLATGITDVVYAFDQSVWDCAAGQLLVEIAGGEITGHDGRPPDIGDFIATNGVLQHEIETFI